MKTPDELLTEIAQAETEHRIACDEIGLLKARLGAEAAQNIVADLGADVSDAIAGSLISAYVHAHPEYLALHQRCQDLMTTQSVLVAELHARKLASEETVAAGWQATLDRERHYAELYDRPAPKALKQ